MVRTSSRLDEEIEGVSEFMFADYHTIQRHSRLGNFHIWLDIVCELAAMTGSLNKETPRRDRGFHKGILHY